MPMRRFLNVLVDSPPRFATAMFLSSTHNGPKFRGAISTSANFDFDLHKMTPEKSKRAPWVGHGVEPRPQKPLIERKSAKIGAGEGQNSAKFWALHRSGPTLRPHPVGPGRDRLWPIQFGTIHIWAKFVVSGLWFGRL